ncbi:TetR/AcrR family transcriptional regulator [Mycobacterium sp. PS03-16]|uniref:TetR/AcrR family transcriptional regulator n=1 Tax=Mycobacterium sp. PS03-16 TaxID=2559611 RepID=UPI0010740B74|nr:TetR/AcrR family transcriptional regulator [Mycobacterium sp. PS03-16]TFV56128.1 TetR/AcrR family transcriptional regulator [Mycobacterium sp. PS03-16]
MAPNRQPARERLLRAADGLFYENGIAATGVDAVIAEAGVATGSLYKNFRGKDDLVAAYLTDRDQRFRALWDTHVAAATDPVDRLLAIFTATQDWARRAGLGRGCAHVAAAAQLPPGHAGAAAAAEHKRHVIARLAELAQDAGLRDPDCAASDLALVYDGMLAAMAVGVEPDPIGRGRRVAEYVIARHTPERAS